MEIGALYPALKRRLPMPKSGWHTAQIKAIYESKHPKTRSRTINVDFYTESESITLFMPADKQAINVLNHIAGIIGIQRRKYYLHDLIGATLRINVKYNTIIKIKTNEQENKYSS